MYAFINCLNRSLVNAGVGTRKRAKLAKGNMEPRAKGASAPKAGVAFGLADGRARVQKFTLEEIGLLDRQSSRVTNGLPRVFFGTFLSNALGSDALQGSLAMR